MNAEERIMTPSLAVPGAIPDLVDGLQRYLREIKKFPILSAEEEFMLAQRWREHKDPKAAEKLVGSHLRLVAKIANGYKGYGLPMADIIAEGNIGLMQALKKYDPEKGHRFSTYAMWWIRANIQEYIIHSWSMVKIGTTATQKKLFFNLKKAKRAVQDLDQEHLSDDDISKIAEELNVPEHEVVHMDRRMQSQDHSLNMVTGASENEEWQDWVADERPDQEEKVIEKDFSRKQNSMLQEAMGGLTPREHYVLAQRRLLEKARTLDSLGQELEISPERVRQIEISAFKKLKSNFKKLLLTKGYDQNDLSTLF